MKNAQPNLLPASWRRRVLLFRRLRQWSAVWTMAVAAAGITCAGKYLVYCQHLEGQKALELEAEPLRNVVKETHQLQNRLAELEGRESLLATLKSADHPLQLVGIVSRSAAETGGKLRVGSFQLKTIRKGAGGSDNQSQGALTRSAGRRRAASPDLDTDQPEQVELEIHGIAADDIAVSDFVSQIRRFYVFDTVSLRSSESMFSDGPREFLVICTYDR